MRNLLLFPGLGDPKCEKYKGIYDLILSYASSFNYDNSTILVWPGQKSYCSDLELTLPSSYPVGIDAIIECERKKTPYRLIARSYGCQVALYCLSKIEEINYLEKLVLWGIVPYWWSYKSFVDNFSLSKQKCTVRDVNIGEDYFKNLIPNELLLTKLSPLFPVTLAIGKLDQYTNVEYLNYLKAICKCDVSIVVIDELGHSIRSFNQLYIDTLLG